MKAYLELLRRVKDTGARKADPQVKITPSLVGNNWYLQIDGYNKRAAVRRVK